MEEKNESRVAIVTGGARGIGKAVARLFAENGLKVVICSRNADELKRAADEINRDFPGRVISLPCDVSREPDVQNLFRTVLDRFGRVDVLVNNAAVIEVKPIEETDLAAWEKTLGINLTGAFLCCREAFRTMREPSGGSIVNISSLAGVPGVEKFPGFGAYTTSKFGLAGLGEILALEGVQKKIRVNTVSPGAVDTEMLRKVAPDMNPKLTPEEVAKVVWFLVSDQAAAVTGTNTELFSTHKFE
jgi:NAD(P)-dependent dehydrogenase (short-subunit alcohol dehydrogenase family)